jgi:hypothetical protein
MPEPRRPAGALTQIEERSMSTETHTMAGLLAPAGAARLVGAASLGCRTAAPALAAYGAVAAHPVSGSHQESTLWTQGAIAKPATFMVFDRKNRPSRPLSELSP